MAALDIGQLQNRFVWLTLLGKLAVVMPDMSFIETSDEGPLKAATGGDVVPIEQKFRGVFHDRIRGKFVGATNKLFTYADKSDAMAIAVAFRYSAATYYRLAGRPLVRARVAELRTLSYRPALDRLTAELPRNIAVLQAIRNDVTANDSSRIRAVEALTNMALRFADIVDLMGRVASLEAMAERPAAGDGYSDESDADESDD